MLNKYNHQLFYWHFELSTKCALKCPRCPRTEKPGQYKVTELSLDFFKRNFPENFVKEYMEKILLCGGQGDPIYCKDMIEIIEYFKNIKPEICICITTNGSYKTTEWWSKLSSVLNEYDEIIFSVDGWDQQSNNLYRVNSDYDSILNAIDVMTKSKALVTVATIIFKFNQDKIELIKNKAKELGVNKFCLTISMLFGSYNESYIDNFLGYDPLEPDKEFVSNYGKSEKRYQWLNEKSHKRNQYDILFESSHKNTLRNFRNKPIMPACITGDRGKYIDVEGILYPCSWVSHPFGIRKSKIRDKSITWENSLWVKEKDKFDLHKRDLIDVLNDPIWEKLFNSWNNKQKCFVECEQKCFNKDYKI